MNKLQAHKILDELKDGTDYTTRTINTALEQTGDLGLHEADRSLGMARPLPRKDVPRGRLCGAGMVGQASQGTDSVAWQGSCEQTARNNEQAEE